MASFSEIFVSILVVGLVVFGAISFAVTTQSDNGASQRIIDDPLINDSFEGLRENLEGLESTSQGQYGNFTSEQPKTGFGSIVVFAIVSVGKNFGNVIIDLATLIVTLPLTVLGIPATASSVIFAWLILSVLVALWILYKLGG